MKQNEAQSVGAESTNNGVNERLNSITQIQEDQSCLR